MKSVAMVFGALLMLQGCTYAISPAMVEKADKTITFEMLRTDPDQYKGRVVILGGTIAQLTNVKQGSLIEVHQKPLDFWGKPTRTTRTGGQFLVFLPRYLDALTFAPGREITFAAEVAGTALSALGDTHYDYPVLVSKEYYLWPKEQKPRDAQAQWGDPLYDPQRQPY